MVHSVHNSITQYRALSIIGRTVCEVFPKAVSSARETSGTIFNSLNKVCWVGYAPQYKSPCGALKSGGQSEKHLRGFRFQGYIDFGCMFIPF